MVKIPTYMGYTERPVKAKYGLWNIIFDGPGADDHTVTSVEAWYVELSIGIHSPSPVLQKS